MNLSRIRRHPIFSSLYGFPGGCSKSPVLLLSWEWQNGFLQRPLHKSIWVVCHMLAPAPSPTPRLGRLRSSIWSARHGLSRCKWTAHWAPSRHLKQKSQLVTVLLGLISNEGVQQQLPNCTSGEEHLQFWVLTFLGHPGHRKHCHPGCFLPGLCRGRR